MEREPSGQPSALDVARPEANAAGSRVTGRSRSWPVSLFGATLAVLAAGLVTVTQTLVAARRTGLWAGDLPAYLVGWRLARTPASLYNLDAQRAMAGRVLGRSGPVPACPFNYPPHLAALGRVLPALTYQPMLHAWISGSAVALVLLIVLWARATRVRVLVAAAVLASPPVAVSALTGSILPIAAAGAVAALVGLRKSGNLWLAVSVVGWVGVATKPHLAVVLAAACVILEPRRAVASLSLAAVPVAVVPTALFGPGIWTDWFRFLGQFSRSQESDLMCRVPRAAPNLEGMLTRAGLHPPLTLIWAAYGLAIVGFVTWVWRTRPNLMMAASVAAAIVPLTAPHANPQDLLLCVPLLVGPAARSPRMAAAWGGVVTVVLLMGTDAFTPAAELGVAAIGVWSIWRWLQSRRSSVSRAGATVPASA